MITTTLQKHTLVFALFVCLGFGFGFVLFWFCLLVCLTGKILSNLIKASESV